MNNKSFSFTAELLKRRAVVYVRQSTQSQLTTNLESKRRQYDLIEMARGYGFSGIDVIDDDLGVSASGCQTRPGFERLVAMLYSGAVEAPCLDRHYPASSVLRACPPPCRPGLVLTDFPVRACTRPTGLPVFASSAFASASRAAACALEALLQMPQAPS